MHAPTKQKSQRLQRNHLSICRRPWYFLCHPTSHQLSSRSQNATTATVRPTWSARLDVQLARHCLRHRHNGTLPLPTRFTCHWQQHEYVILYLYSSLHPFTPHRDNPPPIRHLITFFPSSLIHSALPQPPDHPSLQNRSHSPTLGQPHSLTASNTRLLHRRLLHRHRHKRSPMVRRRPQELQRSRRRTSRRRRRARLRRRQCRRQVQVEWPV